MHVRVLELFCGMGGMHAALTQCGYSYEVMAALDINPNALQMYDANFPNGKSANRNIVSLTAKEINDWRVSLIVMSPPCQPYTRQGKKRGLEDERAESFTHLMSILPDVNFEYLVFENVEGFELSLAHKRLLQLLEKCDFKYQEFVLSPTAVGIPNSRPRYYLIGKKANKPWCFETDNEKLMTTIPRWGEPLEDVPYGFIVKKEQNLWKKRRQALTTKSDAEFPEEFCIGDIVNLDLPEDKFRINRNVISKYGLAMNIVNIKSTDSNCFTGAYARYSKGTGSVLDLGAKTEEAKSNVFLHDLRYFTPKEVGRLMCFPEGYHYPPHVSVNVLYRAIGNSVNVYVVSLLMSLLLSDT